MKACLICPVPSLEQYVDERATHHLLLAHLLGHPGYVEFYRERADQGDYVILDNGAKELGAGLKMKRLLEGAAQVHAKEVVLTDVRYNAFETVKAGQEALDWMMTLEGRIAYDNAGCPKLMLVPQGSNEAEWKNCLNALLEMTDDVRAIVDDMPDPCVAFAYHYDHLFPKGLPGLLNIARTYKDVHLLGWTRKLSTLGHVSRMWPLIRSVDSGRPFSYAKAGLVTEPGVENPGRDEHFFSEPMPDERDELTRSNIDTFRKMAGDVEREYKGAVEFP